MKFAIVILNWNGKHLLERFLPSVCKHSQDADIYVADNASTDDSVAWLKLNFPKVKIIQNKQNEGFAKGYNQALRQVNADIYCLLNSDVKVSENWLNSVKLLFETNKNIAAVQPKIMSYQNRGYFDYAGSAGGFLDYFGYPYCRGRIFDTIEKDEGQYDTDIPIFWASGACLFVRSEDFWLVGGFDEDFFAHQEEIDLCWRLHIASKQVYFSHQSVVYHVGGATLSEDNAQKVYLNFRNNLYMLMKNLPFHSVVFIIIFRLILDGVAGIRFLFQKKISFVWAIVRAHFSFYKYLIMNVLRFRFVSFSKYYNTSFLVWSYFVMKKKFFSDIHKIEK